jgi:hypothetical protein
VFGLFDSEEKAMAAYTQLSELYKETFLTKTV